MGRRDTGSEAGFRQGLDALERVERIGGISISRFIEPDGARLRMYFAPALPGYDRLVDVGPVYSGNPHIDGETMNKASHLAAMHDAEVAPLAVAEHFAPAHRQNSVIQL